MQVWDCFGRENNSSRRDILKIEPELNNKNSILSRSAVTPVFPIPQVLLPQRAPLPARFPGRMQTLATTEQTNVIVPVFKISQVSQFAIISSFLLRSVHALFL